MRDPAHEQHAELKEWIGCDFDPDNVDREQLAAHGAEFIIRRDSNPEVQHGSIDAML
jgi:hypothetical protein